MSEAQLFEMPRSDSALATDPLPHPLADIFPMMSDDELAELAADIAANGLLHPIVLSADGGLILDGRNRLAACRLGGLEPMFETFDGDPAAFIVSANLQRRNLTKGQAAMALAMIYPEPRRGQRTDLLGDRKGGATSFATKEVSVTRLSFARAVLRYGRDDLAPAVLSGARSLDDAFAEAKARKDSSESEEGKLAKLREEAPDLADLVVEGTLTLAEACAALDRRVAEAEAAEKNKRDTLLRLTEHAYRGISAWASSEFAKEVTTRLSDPSFRQQLIDRLRVDPDDLPNIAAAAASLDRLIQRLSK